MVDEVEIVELVTKLWWHKKYDPAVHLTILSGTNLSAWKSCWRRGKQERRGIGRRRIWQILNLKLSLILTGSNRDRCPRCCLRAFTTRGAHFRCCWVSATRWWGRSSGRRCWSTSGRPSLTSEQETCNPQRSSLSIFSFCFPLYSFDSFQCPNVRYADGGQQLCHDSSLFSYI